jgi:hypothetical protein
MAWGCGGAEGRWTGGEVCVLHPSDFLCRNFGRFWSHTYSRLNKQFLLTVTYLCNYVASCWPVTQAPAWVGSDTSVVLNLWSAERFCLSVFFSFLFPCLSSFFVYLPIHPCIFLLLCYFLAGNRACRYSWDPNIYHPLLSQFSPHHHTLLLWYPCYINLYMRSLYDIPRYIKMTFPCVFPSKILSISYFPHACNMPCSSRLSVNPINISPGKRQIWNSSLFNYLLSVVTPSLICPNIFLSTSLIDESSVCTHYATSRSV